MKYQHYITNNSYYQLIHIYFLASILGHYDIAKLLIDKNCDLNARDANGRTPLMNGTKKHI